MEYLKQIEKSDRVYGIDFPNRLVRVYVCACVRA